MAVQAPDDQAPITPWGSGVDPWAQWWLQFLKPPNANQTDPQGYPMSQAGGQMTPPPATGPGLGAQVQANLNNLPAFLASQAPASPFTGAGPAPMNMTAPARPVTPTPPPGPLSPSFQPQARGMAAPPDSPAVPQGSPVAADAPLPPRRPRAAAKGSPAATVAAQTAAPAPINLGYYMPRSGNARSAVFNAAGDPRFRGPLSSTWGPFGGG